VVLRTKLLTVFTIALTTVLAACGVSPSAECVQLDTTAADYQTQASSCQLEAKDVGWAPSCGNGYMEDGEGCDSNHFQLKGCSAIPSFGEFGGGALACDPESCTINVDGCMENFTYPPGPYGATQGMVAENMKFVPANQAAIDLAGNTEVFDLTALYLNSPSHQGNITAVLLVETAGWCYWCGEESSYLNALYNELKDQGLLIVGVVSQDQNYNPATTEYASGYANGYAWEFPAVSGSLNTGFRGAGGMPINVALKVTDMNFHDQFNGALPETNMRSYLTNLVNIANAQ
jgi:glutathione peroxidase-family protein